MEDLLIMKEIQYKMDGTCAAFLTCQLDEDQCVHNLEFVGGCNGNLKAIAKLVEGRPASEVSELLAGNTCGFRQTSCADQLARALTQA